MAGARFYTAIKSFEPKMFATRQEASLLQRFLDDPRTTNLNTSDVKSFHVAVIVKRGKVLAEATNRTGTRSNGSGYSTRSIHAEKNVVKELGDITKMRGADMYVMRISRNTKAEGLDKFLESKPCQQCQNFLEKCRREYGLKGIYYTQSNTGTV